MQNVKMTGSFWQHYQEVVANSVIPYQWKALNDQLPDTEPSHAIKNFRIAAGELDEEYYGMVFQDSDLYKWLEAVAYSLQSHPNPQLEKEADEEAFTLTAIPYFMWGNRGKGEMKVWVKQQI